MEGSWVQARRGNRASTLRALEGRALRSSYLLKLSLPSASSETSYTWESTQRVRKEGSQIPKTLRSQKESKPSTAE